jgi:hypothetical protein
LGHQDVRTTMIYTHVLNRGGLAVRSRADLLAASALRGPLPTLSVSPKTIRLTASYTDPPSA